MEEIFADEPNPEQLVVMEMLQCASFVAPPGLASMLPAFGPVQNASWSPRRLLLTPSVNA